MPRKLQRSLSSSCPERFDSLEMSTELHAYLVGMTRPENRPKLTTEVCEKRKFKKYLLLLKQVGIQSLTGRSTKGENAQPHKARRNAHQRERRKVAVLT
mmetsp:Transcript_34326/g.42311  ORF Transcript_34326/g.42311 Transcript_34326/m.42311 type:complete len:99 (-) Transcript_34326:106-402(-)